MATMDDDIVLNQANADLPRSKSRVNSAAWALTQATAGERIDFRVPRGIFLHKSKKGETPIDPSVVESSWLQLVQVALSYEFEDPSILEEALESDGSGVASVGAGSRVRSFGNGNTALARVGDAVVRVVQADIAYRARISEDDSIFKVKNLLKESNLVRLGKKIKLNAVVRPPMPLSEKQKKSFIVKIMKKVDERKLLARAVLAIVAAVYMDSDFDTVKRVISTLGLFIEKRD